MELREIAVRSLDALKRQGAARACVLLNTREQQEISVDAGRISLFRTTHNNRLINSAILDEKRGGYASNQLDEPALEHAAATAVSFAKASLPDPAYAIAEKQAPEDFTAGRQQPDLELMFERLAAFLSFVARSRPKTMIRQAGLFFVFQQRVLLNSNGVDFSSTDGCYYFSAMFSSKKAGVTTSFNYTSCYMRELDRELIEYGSFAPSLERSEAELDYKPLSGKFEGEIILAPDAVGEFVDLFCRKFLTDIPLVSGTSVLKDGLNQAIAAPALTIKSEPLSPALATNYYFTQDGYKAKNSLIIDKGVLKTFLLSLYGARKTGRERAVNDGSCLIVEPGDMARAELIRSVKRGLYVVRISGGTPNDRGDFSFVAKNSFLIENGEIRYPVNEAMISGNILDMLKNIQGISREQINFGACILPWIKTSCLTISGK